MDSNEDDDEEEETKVTQPSRLRKHSVKMLAGELNHLKKRRIRPALGKDYTINIPLVNDNVGEVKIGGDFPKLTQ